MTHPIADIIGDYRAFTALQRDRFAARGIDIAPYELSHLAVRRSGGSMAVASSQRLPTRGARGSREMPARPPAGLLTSPVTSRSTPRATPFSRLDG
jgi:hypothetical protein